MIHALTTDPLKLPQELDPLVRRVSAMAGDCAADTERRRQLAPELITELRSSGLMRAGAPREVGALELPPAAALRCAEEIARGDASAGWCVSIAITSSLLAAYLPEDRREALFGSERAVAAGVWAPTGRARLVDGGILVSGRWRFCSGIAHSELMFAGCVIDAGEGAGGRPPTPNVVAFRTADLRILDTWRTLGLRGTGSHDAVAEEVFVSEDCVFSLFEGPVLDRPLYRFPIFGFFALSIAAAALGNARAAIDDLVALAAHKTGLGSTRTLAERSATHAAVAQAESVLRGARAGYYEAIDAAWRAAQADRTVAVALRNGIRLAATHAVRTSADVVRTMFDLAGGTAIYDDSPLQRRFRDAHTATAHFQVNAASRELPGRVLLGRDADTMML